MTLSTTRFGGAVRARHLFRHHNVGPRCEYMVPVLYWISAYPAASQTKYGQVTLGSAAQTLIVPLASPARGVPIRQYPHHLYVSSSATLSTGKIVTISGLDFYGRPHTTQFLLSSGSAWYSPVEFSLIEEVVVADDGGDSGKVLRFGDGAGSGIAAIPLFGLPFPLHTGEPGVFSLVRAAREEEWETGNIALRLMLFREPSEGRMRGAFRPSYFDGFPNGQREYAISYATVYVDGDRP